VAVLNPVAETPEGSNCGVSAVAGMVVERDHLSRYCNSATPDQMSKWHGSGSNLTTSAIGSRLDQPGRPTYSGLKINQVAPAAKPSAGTLSPHNGAVSANAASSSARIGADRDRQCKRRSKNPSLKRPVSPVAPE
jgi:hypothetical protein